MHYYIQEKIKSNINDLKEVKKNGIRKMRITSNSYAKSFILTKKAILLA